IKAILVAGHSSLSSIRGLVRSFMTDQIAVENSPRRIVRKKSRDLGNEKSLTRIPVRTR
ncbi:unnamed protein product, partial [Heterotrigona itama]